MKLSFKLLDKLTHKANCRTGRDDTQALRINSVKDKFVITFLDNNDTAFDNHSVISMTKPTLTMEYNENGDVVSYKWADITFVIDDSYIGNRQRIMECFRNYYTKPGEPAIDLDQPCGKLNFDIMYYTESMAPMSCIRVTDAKPVKVSFSELDKNNNAESVIIFTIRPKYCTLLF